MSTVAAGQTVYVVDQDGATFVFATPEAATAFRDDELFHGAEGLTTFQTVIPEDMAWEQAADYACSHGADGTWSPL